MNKQATPSPSSTSRRAVLAGAAGVAAAGVLSTPTLAVPGAGTVRAPSTELLAWREARTAYWAANDAYLEYQHSWAREAQLEIVPIGPLHESEQDRDGRYKVFLNTPESKALDEAVGVTENRLDACVATILARPIRSWHDVAELAEMVRGEQRWNPGERYEDDAYAADPQVAALFDAIAIMAANGGFNG